MRIPLSLFGLLLVLAGAPLGCASNIALGYSVGGGRHCITTAAIGANAFVSDTACVGDRMSDCLARYGNMGGEEVVLCRRVVAAHARAEEYGAAYTHLARVYYAQPLVVPRAYHGPVRYVYRTSPSHHLNHRRPHFWRR